MSLRRLVPQPRRHGQQSRRAFVEDFNLCRHHPRIGTQLAMIHARAAGRRRTARLLKPRMRARHGAVGQHGHHAVRVDRLDDGSGFRVLGSRF